MEDHRVGGASGDESNSTHAKSSKRKRFTPDQIKELEAVFNENQKPDEKTKLELATKLSIETKQVQSWFQNKRHITKSQLEKHENRMLQQENQKLRVEHAAMKEITEKSICDHETMTEHIHLKDQLTRIALHADNFLGPSTFLEGSLSSMMNNFGLDQLLAKRNDTNVDFEKSLLTTNLVNKDNGLLNKPMLMNLALDALDELLKLATNNEPLWVKSLDGGGETLNIEEYDKFFIPIIGVKPSNFTTEATRTSGIVVYDSLTLVETLMKESSWVEMFSCIIGKVNTFDVITTGISESKSGTLLLINAELRMISNMVPIREIQFIRFCQKRPEGIWLIVDVSVDIIKQGSQQYKIENCRRLPSGCIIQDVPNGCSKVTWIEHMEYNEIFVHPLYRPLIKTGLGFGAQRWLSSLQRHSEFLKAMASFINSTVPIGLGILAQRMTRIFCAGICPTSHKWKTIQLENEEYANLLMRENTGDPGEPIGVMLSATKTIRLPMKRQWLFEFFTDKNRRSQWDILSYSGPMQDIVHIFKGQNLDNTFSLFYTNGDNMLVFQDTCADTTSSLIVYATVDSSQMDVVMQGGDSSYVDLLPNGISIVDDLSQDHSAANNNSGSLVTIGFQIFVNRLSATDLPVESIKEANDVISYTIHKIKTALKCK